MTQNVLPKVKQPPLFATSAVKALVLYDHQFLVLCKPSWLKETKITWNDLPGGRIDFGEVSPKEALLREFKEEIGTQEISIIKPIHMVTVVQNSNAHVVATIFLCKAQSKEVTLSDEHQDYQWFDLEDKTLCLPSWIKESLKQITY